MVNQIASVIKVIAIIIVVLGFILGFMSGSAMLLIWATSFFTCMLLLGFAELIEQSTLHNEKMDELLEKLSTMEKEMKSNQNTGVDENTTKNEMREAVRNVSWNEYLSKSSDDENERVYVEPIYLHDGSIKCPLCDTVQSSTASSCWQCEAIFKKENETT